MEPDPEPDSEGEDFARWLDRQGFDNIERLFDGGHWSSKVGLKYPVVRDWLQLQRQHQRSRDARSKRIDVMIKRIIQAVLMVSTIIAIVSAILKFLH